MKCSVIIPVYNAVNFLSMAVESAIQQPETGEVILIDDGSTDGSLSICQALAKQFENVRLLQHSGEKNKGVSASRNLGIKEAFFDYLAFLDADNYYLTDRFSTAVKIFNEFPDCDGVYDRFVVIFENEDALDRFKVNREYDPDHIPIINFNPEDLGTELLTGKFNHLHINGLLIKKECISRSGVFNESLRVGEDTDFIIKLAITSKLFPGNFERPSVVYRFHDHNVFSTPRSKNENSKLRIKLWFSLYDWSKNNATNSVKDITLQKVTFFIAQTKVFPFFPARFFPKKILWIFRFIVFLYLHPIQIFDKQYTKYILSVLRTGRLSSIDYD